ncbi:MAG TPA: phosphoenolpyruvate carboxykinase (ATP), partial [Thermopetrobacter sp.]|nr:phosphoenolpyruvate carboxykinase (ATP) [Thermopetrobacter sp.]
MEHKGRFNSANPLPADFFGAAREAHYNLTQPELYELAIARGEALVTTDGALRVLTGRHTGRSASDKFTVRDAATEDSVWWDNNAAISPEHFAALKQDFSRAVGAKTLFVQDLHGGADPAHRLPVRVVTENAWHALFIRYLLRRPDMAELHDFSHELMIIDLPSFRADPARHGTRSGTVIAIDFSEPLVLIGETSYAGEMKKSVFTTLNYLLPERDVLPMHCSANIGEDDDVALFFGLSGTGKTTLSSDPHRRLIGDDEHGWSDDGVFNFEGGCYAKTIRLSPEAEPEIYAACRRFGTILENVVLDDVRAPDFSDDRYTENGRAAY